MKALNKFLDWLFDSKLIGPVTSGDLIALAAFALATADVWRGAPSYAPIFLGVGYFVLWRIEVFRQKMVIQHVEYWRQVMHLANEMIEAQNAEIKALKAERGETGADHATNRVVD